MTTAGGVTLALLCVCCCWAVTGGITVHVKFKDPRLPLNVRIEDLLSRMTVEEKIGQMAQIERSSASAEVLNKYFIGSVFSGGGSVPRPQATPKDWINMVNGFQRGALSTRLGIPIIYGIDAVHGHGNVYRATVFPHNIGLGAAREPKLVKKIAAATAVEVRATGLPFNFAPCVAVCRDPRWGRCYESFSENVEIVQEMTNAHIPGLQGDLPAGHPKGVPFVAGKKKVASLVKHYVGDGGTKLGINEGNMIISREGLFKIHMPPYETAVKQGVSSVMVSLSSWNGLKMHANRELITGYLKNTLKFEGYVQSDWKGIDNMTEPAGVNYTQSLRTGILAGIDMVEIPFNLSQFLNSFHTLVKTNAIPMSRIDDAVRRILRVKFTVGLFDHPLADHSLAHKLGAQEHRNLAREAVRKSLVLLKNGNHSSKPLLPLPKKARRILVAGTHADNLGYQCGGWTIDWQGVSGNNVTEGTTILSAVRSAVNPSTQVVFSENPDASSIEHGDYSYAIVVVGEKPYAETAGDDPNLAMIEPGPSVIRTVCTRVMCVVVVVSGRPLVLEPYVRVADAVVAAWLPGTEGRGVADVLFGDYGFSGKLPITWFRSVDQLPMNAGDAHYDPLFPFGFGLTTETV